MKGSFEGEITEVEPDYTLIMNSTLDSSLIGTKAFPAVSIIVPTHPQYPQYKLDRDHLQHLLTEAEQQLLEHHGKQKANMIMDRLHSAVNGINFGALTQGLAIYVSSEVQRVINLPFEVTEKVIVDDSFEIRDLLYAAKLNKHFLALIISQNKVSTLFGFGNLFVPVRYGKMPKGVRDVMNQHSLPGWDYLDTKAYDEKNIHNYLRFIDQVIEEENRGSEFPVIVLGDKKINGYIRNHTRNGKHIIGYVDGNYEHITLPEIRKRVEPILQQLSEQEERQALEQLGAAIGNGHYAAGVAEVWRAAAEARGRVLVVEKEYRIAARFGEDNYTILVDDAVETARHKIADAVDDIIEMVLQNNGEVVFVGNGRLEQQQHIALITRY